MRHVIIGKEDSLPVKLLQKTGVDPDRQIVIQEPGLNVKFVRHPADQGLNIAGIERVIQRRLLLKNRKFSLKKKISPDPWPYDKT